MPYAEVIGTLDVSWGSMFSGKSDALIRKVKRQIIAGKKVQVFKPRIDDRYADDKIVTHDGREIDCIVVNDALEFMDKVSTKSDFIAIDEIQFFDEDIIKYINILRQFGGIHVAVAGLDMWATGEPVMMTAKLAAIANSAKKYHAVCVDTGGIGYVSHCLIEKDGDVLVGGQDKYVPLSEKAFLERMRK